MVGVLFSKLFKHKPESAKVRYLTPLVPIIYAFIFAIVAIVFSGGDYNSGWWAPYVFKNPFLLIFSFVLFFTGLHYMVVAAELMGYIGFLAGLYLHEALSNQLIRDKTTKNFKAGFALVTISVIIFSGVTTKDIISYGYVELRYG